MAHYFESGFFVREKAWHGLGSVLQDAPTTADALHQAGLDWPVETMPVHAELPSTWEGGHGGFLLAEDSRAMVRRLPDGTRSVLGIVGTRYVPLQNVDAFRWFDPLVGDGDVSLEAAGSLKNGRNVWILARINGAVERVGTQADDVVTPYLLLSNAHDGTRAVTVAFTPIRVVCWNTLSLAHRAADGAAESTRKVRHSASAAQTLNEVRDTINLARRDFSAKALLWRELGKVPVGYDQLAQFTRAVFGSPAAVAKARAEHEPLPEVRAEKAIGQLFRVGPGADSAGRTAFGAYMAATHYIDHEQGRTADTRLAASWFGTGAAFRERAEAEAMALAGL